VLTNRSRGKEGEVGRHTRDLAKLPAAELSELIQNLNEQMLAAAKELQFELAGRLRDEMVDLKKELRQMVEATR
jgi:excinuclease ABC subunit B